MILHFNFMFDANLISESTILTAGRHSMFVQNYFLILVKPFVYFIPVRVKVSLLFKSTYRNTNF